MIKQMWMYSPLHICMIPHINGNRQMMAEMFFYEFFFWLFTHHLVDFFFPQVTWKLPWAQESNMPFYQWYFITSSSREHWKVRKHTVYFTHFAFYLNSSMCIHALIILRSDKIFNFQGPLILIISSQVFPSDWIEEYRPATLGFPDTSFIVFFLAASSVFMKGLLCGGA